MDVTIEILKECINKMQTVIEEMWIGQTIGQCCEPGCPHEADNIHWETARKLCTELNVATQFFVCDGEGEHL